MIEARTLLQNRYRVEKQIGQGGMGAVYIATDERFGSVVAIKETFFSDEKFGKAFEREARLLNNLKHPALPRVSDHFVDDNGQFLVMEYIEGEDLSEMMEKRGDAFPVEDVSNWAEQLLDALEYLHAQGIVHRDIKPQNLKLTPRGQIILLDFGLAKGNATDAKHQTAAKSVFGYSRNYASLEQIQGTGTEPRSDLYALGATLYHLVTGIPPEDALSRAMEVLSNKPDSLKPANIIEKNVSQNFSNLLQNAMDLNAGNRPVSAQIMREMLNGKIEISSVETVVDYPKSINISSQNIENAQTKIIEGITEQETSVKTRIENNSPNIIVDIPKANNQQRFVKQPEKKKSGILAIAAAGSVLFVAGLGATAYFVKPALFGSNQNASNSSVTNTATNSQKIESKAIGSEVNQAQLSNVNSAPMQPVVTELTEKPNSEPSAQNQQTLKNETVQKKTPDSKVQKEKELIVDTEDAKIYSDGSIETDDLKISADGKIKEKVTPEKTTVNKIPTNDEINQMTMQQRRKMKQVFNNLPTAEKEKIRLEREKMKQDNPEQFPKVEQRPQQRQQQRPQRPPQFKP